MFLHMIQHKTHKTICMWYKFKARSSWWYPTSVSHISECAATFIIKIFYSLGKKTVRTFLAPHLLFLQIWNEEFDTGPAVSKRGNLVPWSAPVAEFTHGPLITAKCPLRVRVQPDHKHGKGMGRVDMEQGPDSV